MAKYESDTMNAGYCEYMTQINATLNVIIARIAIFLVTIALVIVMLVLTLKTIPTVSFMLFALAVFVAWFVFQFTKIEYQYEVIKGELTLSKIYGARVKKKVLSFKTADIIAVSPEGAADISEAKSVVYTCRKNDVNRICIVYSQENGSQNAVIISAPTKTVSCLKYYKRDAFVGF